MLLPDVEKQVDPLQWMIPMALLDMEEKLIYPVYRVTDCVVVTGE